VDGWVGAGADGGRGSRSGGGGLEMPMSPAPRSVQCDGRGGGAGSSDSSQAPWTMGLQCSADGGEVGREAWGERKCIDPGLEVGGWTCVRAARWSSSVGARELLRKLLLLGQRR
jgi:hypothetical protein